MHNYFIKVIRHMLFKTQCCAMQFFFFLPLAAVKAQMRIVTPLNYDIMYLMEKPLDNTNDKLPYS